MPGGSRGKREGVGWLSHSRVRNAGVRLKIHSRLTLVSSHS